MKRNEFLRRIMTSCVAVLALGRLAFSRIATPARQRKPPLTPGNLNRFFARYERERADRSLNEAITDARSFVEKHFSYISPQQEARINKITKEEWQGIQNIINDLKRKRGKIEFKFVNKPGSEDWFAECMIETRLLENGPAYVELKKHLIH